MLTRLFLIVALVFSFSLPAHAASETELVEGARKEGSLTVSTNTLAYPNVLVHAFQQKYPFLKVRHLPFKVGTSTFFTVNLFESEKPEARADVLLRSQDYEQVSWVENGWLADLSSLPNWDKRAKLPSDNKHFAHFLGSPHVVFYDPARVKESDLPRTLEDLAAPRWKGKVAFRNPWRGSTSAFLAHFVKDTRGSMDWFSKMGANHPLATHNSWNAHEAVNSGKYLLGLSRDVEVLAYAHDCSTRTKKKSKLRWRFLESERPFQYELALMSKTAPHPNAAKLFVSWLLSAEASEVLAKAGYSTGQVLAEQKAHPKVWEWDLSKISRSGVYESTLSHATRVLRDSGADMETEEFLPWNRKRKGAGPSKSN